MARLVLGPSHGREDTEGREALGGLGTHSGSRLPLYSLPRFLSHFFGTADRGTPSAKPTLRGGQLSHSPSVAGGCLARPAPRLGRGEGRRGVRQSHPTTPRIPCCHRSPRDSAGRDGSRSRSPCGPSRDQHGAPQMPCPATLWNMKDSLLNLYFSIKISKHKSSVTNITTLCHINRTYRKGLQGAHPRGTAWQKRRAGGRPTAQGA